MFEPTFNPVMLWFARSSVSTVYIVTCILWARLCLTTKLIVTKEPTVLRSAPIANDSVCTNYIGTPTVFYSPNSRPLPSNALHKLTRGSIQESCSPMKRDKRSAPTRYPNNCPDPVAAAIIEFALGSCCGGARSVTSALTMVKTIFIETSSTLEQDGKISSKRVSLNGYVYRGK